MTKKLTFLQDIVRAYQHEDYAKFLTAFFYQANRLKRNSQFALFMNECLTHRDELEQLGILQKFLSADDGQNLEKYKLKETDSALGHLLNSIAKETNYSFETANFEIRIFFNNEIQHQVEFSRNTNLHICKNILPGMYVIKLSTGRIIWKKHLTSPYVLLTPSIEQTEFKLAAQTRPRRQAATLEYVIMDKIRIKVIAGANGGTMEIKLL